MRVNGHICACLLGASISLMFLRFVYYILELFEQLGIFGFPFYV